MTPSTKQTAVRLGRVAEQLCAMRLMLTGWRILERGKRGGRGTGAGEIDLIARRGSVLAFIEVKARPTTAAALAAVTPEQQIRITRGAEAYVARNPRLAGCVIRFDVMAVRPWRLPVLLADAWRP